MFLKNAKSPMQASIELLLNSQLNVFFFVTSELVSRVEAIVDL